jgi:hypothetical protein
MSFLRQHLLEEYWSFWRPELMSELGLTSQEAGRIMGYVLKHSVDDLGDQSISKARLILGNLRESKPERHQIWPYLKQALNNGR